MRKDEEKKPNRSCTVSGEEEISRCTQINIRIQQIMRKQEEETTNEKRSGQ
jgi:hypothetical protein